MCINAEYKIRKKPSWFSILLFWDLEQGDRLHLKYSRNSLKK